jgi:hypothetical protein
MGVNILTGGLTAIALIVIFGSPIWFSVKARRLGPLPYRWGTYVGIWSLLFSFALLVAVAKELGGSEQLIVGIIPMLEMAGAIGVLRRKRWGVALLLTSHVALILVRAFLSDSDDMPAPSALLAATAGVGVNLWYFGRRWRLMGEPLQFDSAEDSDEVEPGDQPSTAASTEDHGTA